MSVVRPMTEPHLPRHGGIGLVPTMGALHAGHTALFRAARADCDVLVASLFVNPVQFSDNGDLAAYPRDFEHDATLAEAEGVDVIFAPSVEEVYPPGFATAVEVIGLTHRLEGAARGTRHARGVTTVLTKLLCIALPNVAACCQ
mgnify:CR=1 FL=1